MGHLGRAALASLVTAVAAFTVTAAAPSAAWGDPGHQAVAKSASVRTGSVKTGWLWPGQTLKPGQSVRSNGGEYVLTQQEDGNLVLRNGAKVLWNTATAGANGAVTVMQLDGNLVVRQGGKPLWDSHTGGQDGARLAVQDDGNLVLYDEDGKPLWSRHTLIAKLLPGQRLQAGDFVRSLNRKFKFVQGIDGNLVLYSGSRPLWDTETQSRDGVFTAMQPDGNLVVRSAGGKALWASNTGRNPGAWLAVQNDGNAVIYSKGGEPLWSTETGGGN
ncbi:curculin domain-containing protein [Nonomuraea lactucae]|uniref:curculin domain-containing protein n=1 Tax=Nonomuraea lactucae TaxID=2249762 RepID=UPI000DE2A7FB|nr:curculin domain-containing protein [Nonomuraea lactucae]